jgi:hypothetical protein
MRTEQEIQAAAQEYCEKVWYERHCRDHPPGGRQVAKRIRAKYEGRSVHHGNIDELAPFPADEPMDPFTCGFINGKLAALRWVLFEKTIEMENEQTGEPEMVEIEDEGWDQEGLLDT